MTIIGFAYMIPLLFELMMIFAVINLPLYMHTVLYSVLGLSNIDCILLLGINICIDESESFNF